MRNEPILRGRADPGAVDIAKDADGANIYSENESGTVDTAMDPLEAGLGRFPRQQEEMLRLAPGRKLDGRPAPTGRVNEELRYKQGKLHENAAVVRHWEDTLLRGIGECKQQLLPSRLFYSRARGYPLCVMSVVHYAPEAEKAKMEKNLNVDSEGLTVFNLPLRDWRGNSYITIMQVVEKPQVVK